MTNEELVELLKEALDGWYAHLQSGPFYSREYNRIAEIERLLY